ncbi:S9 family peptidase [Halotalea alkalilenta]|uniref:S9 family peptidase n=1 Tax=Halotalea alkalilenta TaxID=376489 RepID=UPI00069339CC|nr:S9 family peptidase [Halotalea alkalilenta]
MTTPGFDIETLYALPSLRAPTLCADGKRLAYLSDESGFDQLWLLELESLDRRRLSDWPEPLGSISFSPSGDAILFTYDHGGDERHQFALVDLIDGSIGLLTDDPSVVHLWGAWSPDGRSIAFSCNARDRRHMDVHLLDVESGARRCLVEGDGFREVVGFFPSGDALLVRVSPESLNDQQLYRLEIESGNCHPLLEHAGPARYSQIKFGPDDQALVLGDQERERPALCRADRDFTRLETLVESERCELDGFARSRADGRLAWTLNRDGWSELWIGDGPDGGDAHRIEGHPPGVISNLAWHGQALLFALEGATTPSGLWRHRLGQSGCERLLPLQSTSLPQGIEPTLDEVPSFDGLRVPFLRYRPRGPMPAAGYPCVIVIHGGPEAQWRPTFRADLQCLLDRGVMVLAPNVRGSTGYGKRYHQLDDRERRLDALKDLMAVRDWCDGEKTIDAGRVMAYGRSYGGFMVLSALTEHPGRWRLGVEFYGIGNFHTLLETTGPWRRRLRASEYGDPETQGAELERFSPIHRISRIEVPLLIVQGLEDPRVPPGESEMVYSCLRGLGREVDYLRVPHAGHGFLRRDQRRRVFSRTLEFIARHL